MQIKPEHPEYTVKAVSYALAILELLAEHPTGLSLMQLADRFELSRNKTFRLMTTLCETGLVERDADTGMYRLGACSVALGQKFLMNSSVVNYAHPVIENLARKHGEAVYMSVIRDDEVLFLDMVDFDQQVKLNPLLGRRFPFFTNAAGKVMKALDSRDLLERIMSRRGRRKAGAPDLNHLASELEEIRSRGVAVDSGGLGEGVISVAVAVRDYAGKAVCAITLIGPSFRLLSDRLEKEIIPSLKEGADLLSGRFGYLPT
jgi:DNA-binding IclR family transcriptional regulator